MGRKKRLTDSEIAEYSQGKHGEEVKQLGEIAQQHLFKLPCTPDDLRPWSREPIPDIFIGKMIFLVEMNYGGVAIIANPRFNERGLIEYINLYDTTYGYLTLDPEDTKKPRELKRDLNRLGVTETLDAVGQVAGNVANATVNVAGNVKKGWDKTAPARGFIAGIWKAFDSSNDKVMGGNDR